MKKLILPNNFTASAGCDRFKYYYDIEDANKNYHLVFQKFLRYSGCYIMFKQSCLVEQIDT